MTSYFKFGVMFFFVKKTDGLLVMDEPTGAPIDVQLMWALDCVPPTVEQLGTMTLNSLECFPHQFGYRIKNAVGHGKDSLISYILGKWNFYVEKALEATHIRPSVKLNHKGKPFFIDNGRGMCPMLIRAGQIVELNHLTTYTADITKDIFDTMTATELRWSISVVFGHHKFEDKTHDALVNRLHELYVAHVNLHEQELLTIPIADDDLPVSSGDDEGQAEIERKKDAELQMEIETTIEMYSKFDSMDFSSYLSSAADFFDNLVKVDFLSIADDRVLFSLPLSLTEMSVTILKREVFLKVREVQMKNGLSGDALFEMDSFFLSDRRFKFMDMVSLHGIEGNRIYFGLKLRGGGKPKVIKTTLKCKTSTKTTTDDRVLFEKSYTNALKIGGLTADSIDIKAELKQMSISSLEEMKSYLVKDKTKKALKIEKLVSFVEAHKEMTAVQEKITSALNSMKEMFVESAEGMCCNSEGETDFTDLLELINKTIGAKEQEDAML